MNPLSPQYVAGFFDGEGCIIVAKDSGARHNKRPSYVLRVDVANTDYRVLEMLQREFGGNIARSHGKNRPCYNWQVNAQLAKKFLEWVRPYLTVKAEQAWLALEFMSQRGLGGGKGRPLTEEDYALREGYYLALQNAKRL